MHAIPRLSFLAIALLAALSACKGGDGVASPQGGSDARPDRGWTDAARVEAIASTLQACSYEGKPVTVEPGQLQGPAPGDCEQMVDRIMTFTGLPANFIVTAGPVDNAAAVILLDRQRVPQRVIAFNPDFINLTKRATGGDTWAPVSIMAHEIGHHLSGHTITGGGSRPEIELEADKFSGYVLQKMGAPLADATKAILTFGTDADQPTHPSKDKRATAISQGWQEACVQTGGANCGAGAGASTPVATPPPRTANIALPAPSTASIPVKYGRFVVDEFGKLDPAEVAALDRKLYDFASNNGVEIALLLVKDLRGMTPEDYAWAMMRQLRIGKLDVGNGAVIVVAPEQNQAGVAYGPGVAEEMRNSDPKRQLMRWIEGAWQPVCIGQGSCKAWTGSLFMLPESIMNFTRGLEWTIRYQSMKEFLDTYKARFEEDSKLPANRTYDPKRNVAYDKIVRFRGKVVDLDTPVGIAVIKPEILSNAALVKRGYRPVHVQSEDGIPVVFYVEPRVEALMPAGALKVDSDYTFVGRVQAPNPIAGQAQHLMALSYDPLR